VRVARELVRQITARTTRIRELQAELAALVESCAPQLLAERGCGPLTAAKLIGEIAGADRFATDAKLARTGGAAPIAASSGNSTRHRLDRGGNRQLNCALHRLAVNKANWDADTAADLERKRAERKSREEALRCLKRHLARRAWRLLRSAPTPNATPVAHDSGSSAFSSRRSGRCRQGGASRHAPTGGRAAMRLPAHAAWTGPSGRP
jgi:transposase